MEDRYLFRGKRIDNGEWIVGNLITNVFFRLGQSIPYILCPDKADYDCFEDFTEENGIFEVYPSTICRCTGLRDKNGKLIWENDIVRHYNNPSKPDTYDVGLILFQDHSPGFERTSRMHDDNVGICMDCVYEVIGNVFDNPELLEVQE